LHVVIIEIVGNGIQNINKKKTRGRREEKEEKENV